MKLTKKAAGLLAAAALFGTPFFPATCSSTLQTAEAAFAPNTADQTPYEKNIEIDPYGQSYLRALPGILRVRRETMEATGKKMPWSGFGAFTNPGEAGNVFGALNRDAMEEQEEALSGKSMPIYRSKFVQRMDTSVVSFLESNAAYQGGHRGRYGVSGRNYDTRWSKELTLDDMFTDTAVLPGLIAERLRSDYPGVAFRDALEDYLSEKVEKGHLQWTLFARGATFYFTPYDIVAGADRYDAGQMIYTATIFFHEAPELFDEEYRMGAPAWSFELEPFMPVRVPLGDGTTAMLTVGGQKIRLGDFELVEEEPLRYQRWTFVSLMDGRRYLYADVAPYARGEALPHELRVYRLSPDGVERLPGSRPLTMLASIEDEDDRLILPMISPGNFCLCDAPTPGEAPTDHYRWLMNRDIGSANINEIIEEEKKHAHYHVGPDGWPEEGAMRGY